MQQLIATYLFKNKYCPLADVGHLKVEETAAETNFLNKQIIAPKKKILFLEEDESAENFISFVAKERGISIQNAEQQIKNFTEKIKQNTLTNISGVGSFSQNENGLHFSSIEIEDDFLPNVVAEKIIHKDAEHTMVVGDKETTTTEMTEYYAEHEAKKEYWWIWALVLGVIGVATILFFYFAQNQNF